MSDQKSMGDLFRQRRAAAAAGRNNAPPPTTGFANQGQGAQAQLNSLGGQGQPQSQGGQGGFGSQGGGGGGGGGGGRKSFADIQREQAMEEQRQRDQGGGRMGGGGGHHGGGRMGGGGMQHPTDDFGRLKRPSNNPRDSARDGGHDGGGYGSRPSNNPRDSARDGGHDGGGFGSRSSNSRGDRGDTMGNSRGDSRRGGRSQRADPRASMPVEQGVVHTLLDKFGFITCADRDKELFFHYSEYRSGHSDDLNIGDEVEFRVGKAEERRGRGGGGGGGDSDKWSAFEIKTLPKGTIIWEKEDEPGKRFKGTVEQVARDESSRHRQSRDRGRSGASGAVEGTIRLVADNEEGKDEGDKGDEGKTEGEENPLEIYYTPKDYTKPQPGHNRLDRKDLVEFTLVTVRRTGKKVARNISLVRSERDRAREERETKMLENAPLEQGIVVTDKGDFGFLRSATREGEVYFHISNLIPTGDDGEAGADAGRVALREGQEVQFYVVNEQGSGGGGKNGGKRLGARKIQLLPKGTVKFEHKIAEGVTGLVVECPVSSVSEPFGRRDDRKAAGKVASVGKIQLEQPIMDDDGNEVTEVILRPELYPGGTFAINRMGSEMGCWIRPNDTLLFDVIQKVANGNCYAVPTKFVHAAEHRPEGWNLSDSKTKAAVRLVGPSLCGRMEGVVRSVHDNYGFVHLAERAVDAYVPLFEVFPTEMQGDLASNNPDVYKDVEKSGTTPRQGGRVHLDVGMEVIFDVSLQMIANAGPDRRGGRYGKPNNRAPQEKESLRARRVQILPKGTINEKIMIASGVKAIVTKGDPKQPFVGMLELENSIKVESAAERHPLVEKLLEDIVAGKFGDEVEFHDVLSERDAQVVISMVNSREDLDWRYIPEEASEDSHSRRLCVTKNVGEDDDDDVKEQPEEAAKPSVAASATFDSVDDANGEKGMAEVKAERDSEHAAPDDSARASERKHDHKKKAKKAKITKSIRYDKISFPDVSVCPLGVGDVLTCDIVQIRRSGAIAVENIAVVERKERPPVVSDTEEGKDTQQKSLQGFVTEVVPSRQFGFITAVDESGTRTGEHVFFHFREIKQPAATSEYVAQDGATSSLASRKKSRARGASIDLNIRKGDEVKFDVGPSKNGKVSAANVTILQRGTLKLAPKAEKSQSCTGYVLMEPSHTSLANTPSHVVLPSGQGAAAAGGRWANVRDDNSNHKSGSHTNEGGVILLLSDPAHLFSARSNKADSPTKKDAIIPAKKDADAGEALPTDSAVSENHATEGEVNAGTDAKNGEGKAEAKDETLDVDSTPQSVVGTHVHYRPSSVAHRTDGPRRGDLVTFGKARGVKLVKDIRIEKVAAANSVRGTLVDIDLDGGTAVFVSAEDEKKYGFCLTEVVSCEKLLLKDKEQVDGILHEGKIYGVCRTKDIFLASSSRNSSGSSSGLKERPRLNLTVKKELRGMGGKIMAQSRMAKGPNDTNGFAQGWTSRKSVYAAKKKKEEEAKKKKQEEEEMKKKEEEEERAALERLPSLSAAASEFVPNFPTPTSGFEAPGGGDEQ